MTKAVGGGYCRLQMPLRLALGVRETVAGHRLGALEGGGYLPPFQCIAGAPSAAEGPPGFQTRSRCDRPTHATPTSNQMLLLDPSFLFCVICLAVPLHRTWLEQPQTFHEDAVAYLTDPALIAGGVALALGLLCAVGGRGTRTRTEELVANWFLMNGAIIHITMDGLTGGWHMLPLMYKNYIKVDRRFEACAGARRRGGGGLSISCGGGDGGGGGANNPFPPPLAAWGRTLSLLR